MNTLLQNSTLTDTLGWTLIHFLWQGSLLALVLYVFTAFTRRPVLRYWAGLLTLGMMCGAPLFTFFYLLPRHHLNTAPSKLHVVLTSIGTVAQASAGIAIGSSAHSLLSINWTVYFVWAWLAGVAVFALRALGGYMVLRNLMREKCEPLEAGFRERCQELQQQLRLNRAVRYCQSRLIGAPAVVGWLQPVVLLPISALTGLSARQLEAVIAHELAHIRRFDCFVNLFQIAAETVLFYHPAIWWVNRLLRNERENCCDDVAVETCGDAGDYARALALMATWRNAPLLALAANQGSLKNRVGRILGVDVISRSVPHGGLAMLGSLCIAGAILSAAMLNNAFAYQTDTQQVEPARPLPAAPAPRPWPPAPPPPSNASPDDSHEATAAAPEPPPSPLPPDPPDQEPQSASENNGQSYIDGLNKAGLRDLDVGNLIALKTQGVTPAYVREMRAAGVDTSVGELIAMKVQGVSADYVRKLRAAGWRDATAGQIIAMKTQHVDPSQAGAFKREFGLDDLSLGQLIAFKVQGITPEYVRGLRAAGIKDLSTGQIIAAKVQGVTPEFIQNVRAHGLHNLSLQQLIELKVTGVF